MRDTGLYAGFDIVLGEPEAQAGLGDPEVFGDLSDRNFTLPSDRDHISTELFRISSGYDNILPVIPRGHRSDVSQTHGGPFVGRVVPYERRPCVRGNADQQAQAQCATDARA